MSNTSNQAEFNKARLNADHAEALKIARRAGKVAKLATKMVSKGEQKRYTSTFRDYDPASLTMATNAELRELQPGTEVQAKKLDGGPWEGSYDYVELTAIDGQPIEPVDGKIHGL